MKVMKLVIMSICVSLLISCSAPEDITITIQPDGNKMQYATTEFTVKKGQNVTLVMDNIATVEVMKHNIVILDDETKINEIGMAAVTAPGYLPEHPSIIAATPMADAGAKSEITFKAPEKSGRYAYICTYPGHYSMMKGVMIVK